MRVDRTPEPPGQAVNALGHWYANVLTLNRTPLVVAISERSLLSVVLTGAPFSSLATRFPHALAQLLQALGVPEDQVAAEVACMFPLTIAATASRKLLGCLNQYAFELSVHLEASRGRASWSGNSGSPRTSLQSSAIVLRVSWLWNCSRLEADNDDRAF